MKTHTTNAWGHIRSLGLLTCTFLLLSACNETPKSEKPNPEEPVQETPEMVKAPRQIISLDKADGLYKNYSKNRAESIAEMEAPTEDGKPFVPTRFLTISIEDLEQYIAFAKQEATKGEAEIDSLRIYLANYGKVKGKKDRRNTLFILPAAEAEGDYGGIYIGEDGKAKLIRNYFNANAMEQKSKASFMPNFKPTATNQGGQSLILNDLGDSPPPKEDF